MLIERGKSAFIQSPTTSWLRSMWRMLPRWRWICKPALLSTSPRNASSKNPGREYLPACAWAHFTSHDSQTGQFHETISVSRGFHAILQRLTRLLPKTNFFVIPPFSRISGGSIRGIKVSRELKSFVFLRIGYSKCRPIPFFSSKRAFDADFSSSRTKDTFRF